jgi:Pyruvate/2-oxoacid:ferredoxin oxidoreductase delta subunit
MEIAIYSSRGGEETMAKELPVVPTAAPGSLAEISAAPSWREYRPEVHEPTKVNPIIVLFCPDGAITSESGKTDINLGICKGCGICAVESEGIVMVPEYIGVKGVFGVKEDNR